MKWKPDIILNHITEEMEEWLEENCDGRHSVGPHIVRFRWAGPSIPLNKCQRHQGWEIYFDDDELAMAFKLRWL